MLIVPIRRTIVPSLPAATVQHLCAQHPFFAAKEDAKVSPQEAAAVKATLEAFAAGREEAVEQKHVPYWSYRR